VIDIYVSVEDMKTSMSRVVQHKWPGFVGVATRVIGGAGGNNVVAGWLAGQGKPFTIRALALHPM